MSGIPWLEHGFATRLSTNWPGERTTAKVRQIHSDVVVSTEGRTGLLGDGDALVTGDAGTFLVIRTADCLPILMADRRLRVVAAVHAGWRGIVSGIAAKTVAFMGEQYGTRLEDLAIAAGPGIGECCFEVGPEVSEFFNVTGRTHIDLAGALRRQLREIGIAEDQLVAAALCTCCGAGMFHSYRRDREASGRMVSGIVMT